MRSEIISLTLTTGEEMRVGKSLDSKFVSGPYSGTCINEIRRPVNPDGHVSEVERSSMLKRWSGKWFEVDWSSGKDDRTFTIYVNPASVALYTVDTEPAQGCCGS